MLLKKLTIARPRAWQQKNTVLIGKWHIFCDKPKIEPENIKTLIFKSTFYILYMDTFETHALDGKQTHSYTHTQIHTPNSIEISSLCHASVSTPMKFKSFSTCQLSDLHTWAQPDEFWKILQTDHWDKAIIFSSIHVEQNVSSFLF